MHWYSSLLLRGLAICLVKHHCWSVVCSVVVAAEIVRMAVVSASRLRDVWHDLHAARNNTSRTTTSSSIGGCSRTSKSLSELLEKCTANIVCGNVNSISYAKNHKRTLSR